MDANPKHLIVTILVVVLSACAAPPRMTQVPPPPAKPPASSVTKSAAAPGSGENATPETAPPEKVLPIPAQAEGGTTPQAKGQTETAPPAARPQTVPKTAAPAAAKPPAPSKPRTVVADRIPREFTLTVGAKDASHPYYGRGHDIGFIVDGVQGKELVLTRGVTYTFHVDTNVQHDFYFSTSPMGRGAGTVTDGITGQFTYRGDVTFTPGDSTPDVVYYECRNHAFMGGKIHIADAGDKVTVGGEQDRGRPPPAAKQTAVSAAQVKQKLGYAEMLMGSSPAMKRVTAGDNAQAKGLAANARRHLADAKAAMGAGDNAAAMRGVNEAIRLFSAAVRLVPDPTDQIDYKSRYSDLAEQLRSFDKSYEKNLERGIKPKSGQGLDKAEFDQLVKEAEGFAGREQYEEAAKRLERANEMLTAALGALLQSQTVVYDKNFATPKEEYKYELARYDSYAELIPLAIEQRKPTEQTVSMMDKLAARAKEIRDEGVGIAAKGDHKKAILALQAATERLRQALRLAGVQ
jgi:tetratricopeptide (TPR) repeat protein